MVHSCLDAVEAVLTNAARSKGKKHSGPKWPPNLILGEAAQSKVSDIEADPSTATQATAKGRGKRKAT
jgi:hypothetical protein